MPKPEDECVSADRVTTGRTTVGTLVEGLELRISGPTEVVARTVTLEAGEDTGWHYHPGEVLVVVEAGTLTRSTAAGTHTHPSGTAFVEASGTQQVHKGCNLGSEPVVLHMTYLNPAGSPLSVPVTVRRG